MGFAVTLIAVSAEKRDAFLGAAGVTETGEAAPYPTKPVSAGCVGDHYVIWRNMRDFRSFELPDGKALSRCGAQVLVLHVVDTVGAQELGCYENGEELWTITFNEVNPDMLASTGSPPLDPMQIVKELHAEDPDPEDGDSVDLVVYYGGEVPGRVFAKLVGRNHETLYDNSFVGLSGDLPCTSEQITKYPDPQQGEPKRKWWKFW